MRPEPIGERVARVEEAVKNLLEHARLMDTKLDTIVAGVNKMNGSQARQDTQLAELAEEDAKMREDLRPLVEDYTKRSVVSKWLGGAWGAAAKFVGFVGAAVGIAKALEKL